MKTIPTTLKEAVYEVVHRSEKPLKQIAEDVDMSVSHLTRSALPDSTECETGSGCALPSKKIVPITISTQNFAILDYFEQACGRVAFPIPKSGSKLHEICRISLKSCKEFGDLMAVVEKSVVDGEIDPDEMKRISKEGYEAIQAIALLISTLEKKAGEY